MITEEINNELMYCLFAPDGNWQPTTLAHSLPMCQAVIKILHSKGLGKSLHELKLKGFKILPLLVTATVGTTTAA